MKTAIFPGSFDPITKGHQDIILRALPLFDKIIVAVGKNTSKKYMYSQEQRVKWIKTVFKKEKKISLWSLIKVKKSHQWVSRGT